MVKKTYKNNVKYFALFFGVILVAAVVGSSFLQSTFGLAENWALKMSISDIMIDNQDVWPGDSIRVSPEQGGATTGYDLVALSVDGIEPIDPNGAVIQRYNTGKPALIVSLGGFTQPVATIDSTSVQGTKIYTWRFVGFISIQTMAVVANVDDYTFKIDDSLQIVTNEVGELGILDVIITIDFDLMAGDEAKGSCKFENAVSEDGLHRMVDSFGAAADFVYGSTVVESIDTLDLDSTTLSNNVKTIITGKIASGAEISSQGIVVYNMYAQYPIDFTVVQTVGEFDTARFMVPSSLQQLPMSFDELFAPEALLANLIWFVMLPLLFIGIFYGIARWAYGDAMKSLPKLGPSKA